MDKQGSNEAVIDGEITYIYDSKGNQIKVDTFNYEKVKNFKWRIDSKGNAMTTINRKTVYMHQIIMGEVVKGMYIVHINGNNSDNTSNNLELRTRSKISHSRGLLASNTSGTTGVTKTKSGYRVRLWLNNKTIELGSSKTLEEAMAIRELAEVNYGIS